MKKQIIGYLNKDVRDVAGDISKGYQRVVKGVDNLVIDVQANLSMKAAGIALVAGLSACTPAFQVKNTNPIQETLSPVDQLYQILDQEMERYSTALNQSRTAEDFFNNYKTVIFLEMMDADRGVTDCKLNCRSAVSRSLRIKRRITQLARLMNNYDAVDTQLNQNGIEFEISSPQPSREEHCQAAFSMLEVGKAYRINSVDDLKGTLVPYGTALGIKNLCEEN